MGGDRRSPSWSGGTDPRPVKWSTTAGTLGHLALRERPFVAASDHLLHLAQQRVASRCTRSEEELEHAMRLFDYVLRRGGRVELDGVDAPTTDFGPPLTLFESVLEHERAVTGMIHRLFELSGKEGDWAAQQELQWFISEQVEEEDTAATARDQVRMAGDDQAALLMLDQQFGSRVADAGEA